MGGWRCGRRWEWVGGGVVGGEWVGGGVVGGGNGWMEVW